MRKSNQKTNSYAKWWSHHWYKLKMGTFIWLVAFSAHRKLCTKSDLEETRHHTILTNRRASNDERYSNWNGTIFLRLKDKSSSSLFLYFFLLHSVFYQVKPVSLAETYTQYFWLPSNTVFATEYYAWFWKVTWRKNFLQLINCHKFPRTNIEGVGAWGRGPSTLTAFVHHQQ